MADSLVALPTVSPAVLPDTTDSLVSTPKSDGGSVVEDGPPQAGQRIPGTLLVACLAIVVGVISTTFMFHQDWLLLYSDAQSHLTIARRIFDSKEPGFAQIGTVWLPIPHLLLLPLVTSYALWHTGLAAAIVGTGCLAVSAGALWHITARVGFVPSARAVTVAVFVLNPSILYLYTVALTEPVLIACLLAAIAGLAGWIFARPTYSPGQLAISAGIPSAAAVLTRYEGWAFVLVGTLFVVIASWRRWRSVLHTLALVGAYLVVPLVAVTWWLTFNWVVFGSPLEFAQGVYSAAAQQRSLATAGLLPTQGNLALSLDTFDWSVIGFMGLPMLVLAGIGAVIVFMTRGLSTTSLIIWMPGFIYPFAVLSLVLGQTAIRNDHSLPPGLFNIRFAAGLTPLIALLVGALVSYVYARSMRTGWAVAAIALATTAGFTAWSYTEPLVRIDVIREGISTTHNGADSAVAAAWLAANNDGGDILIDEGANPILMQLDVPLKNIYARFTGSSFERALATPVDYATWVYVNTANPGDIVWKALKDDPGFASRFAPVFESGPVRIYELTSAPVGGR